MVKGLLLIVLFSFIYKFSISQVYQLHNGGFEQWDGNGSNDEPINWNGFPSANCELSGLLSSFCGTATATRHSISTDIRPDSEGVYSCKIFATSINLGVTSIIANGNITTGQIRIGSSTAASKENYNITKRSNSNYNHQLNAKPDSIVFWAKFKCPSSSQEARMNAVIHDDYDYRDPQISDENAMNYVVGKASLNFSRGDQNWKRYSIPFNYDDTYFPATIPSYILITFTTNKEPGKGSNEDILFIDDIELVYNTTLKEIFIDGLKLNDFNPYISDYYIDMDCDDFPVISFTTFSQNAVAKISNQGKSYTITVTNGDKIQDYNLYFYKYEYIIDEICQGKTYNNNGFDLPQQDQTGTFIFTKEIEDAPCESYKHLSLTVNPNYYTATPFDLSICEGFVYDFFGELINVSGTYEKYVNSSKECDSLVILNLTVTDHFEYTIKASICEGDVYNKNGFYESTPGIHTKVLKSQMFLCDSIINLDLSVNKSYFIEIYDTIYKGEMYFRNGFSITDTNGALTIVDTLFFKTYMGCDSIIYLNLKIMEYEIEYPPTNANFKYSIYPNPAKNNFKIEIDDYFAGDLYYKLYSPSGGLILSGRIEYNNYEIDVSKLQNGTYILKLFLSKDIYKISKVIVY